MYNNPPNTLFIGQNLVYLPDCHSTNDTAAELAKNQAVPEGTIVIAGHQSQGRGQRGNVWQTEPGKNFTFSLIVKPSFLSVMQQFQLTIAVSAAIHAFVRTYVPQGLCIKWPNDLYWNDYKMGGILIENTVQGVQLSHSIIGIGLNINQIHFPANPRATSLRLATFLPTGEDDYDLEILLPLLLELLEKKYLQLRSGNFYALKAYYLAYAYGYGKERLFLSQGKLFRGQIIDFDEIGRLGIRSGDQVCYYAFKEVEFVF